jgi:hypothetical protein
VGLAPTGKRRLFTAHADSGHSRHDDRSAQVDPFLPFPSAVQTAEAERKSWITGDQKNNGVEVPMALANDMMLIIQGMTPPEDKSSYPRTARARRRRAATR